MKQIFGSLFIALLFIANLRTDILKDESRNNLIWLKLIYYLMTNDQMNHKFNNCNHKILKIITKCTYLIIIKQVVRTSIEIWPIQPILMKFDVGIGDN